MILNISYGNIITYINIFVDFMQCTHKYYKIKLYENAEKTTDNMQF